MRRYIPYLVLAIALPILFFIPLVYQRWSHARREEAIQKAMQKARRLDGLTPEAALAQLTQGPSASTVTLLYTGNTQGHLEACGCYIGQSGGVARRATVVEQFRSKGLQPLLVDVGGWLNAENADNELEKLKFQTYLSAMDVIGYAAVSPSPQDFRWGPDFLFTSLKDNHLPFLMTAPAPDAKQPIYPYQTIAAGQKSVTLLGTPHSGLSSYQVKASLQETVAQMSNQTDIVVLLSSLSPPLEEQIAKEVSGIDLIISASEREKQTIGGTLLVGSVSGGKMVGFAHWRDGDTWETGQIYMTEEVPEHPEVRVLVQAFYQRIAQYPKFYHSTKRLFASEPLERDSHNSFVGSDACQSCHQEEYQQWETTAHAAAYHTLLQAQRHFYPGRTRCCSFGGVISCTRACTSANFDYC